MSRETPEDFLRDFFECRREQLQRELVARVPFRRRFFTEGCVSGSGGGMVERSEAETIDSVRAEGAFAEVITRQAWPRGRLRYHLREISDTWIIAEVMSECAHCQGETRVPACVDCHGTGWLSCE